MSILRITDAWTGIFTSLCSTRKRDSIKIDVIEDKSTGFLINIQVTESGEKTSATLTKDTSNRLRETLNALHQLHASNELKKLITEDKE